MIFQYFSRQILFSRKPSKFKYFSSLSEPCPSLLYQTIRKNSLVHKGLMKLILTANVSSVSTRVKVKLKYKNRSPDNKGYFQTIFLLRNHNICCGYNKTCVKQPLKIDKIKILMTNGSLMKVESIAECSPWSILQYFDLH